MEKLAEFDVERADQSVKKGELWGPVRVRIGQFRPIIGEVLFLEMQPDEDGQYEPLLGYIALQQASAAVDMLGHRLVHVKRVDLKCLPNHRTPWIAVNHVGARSGVFVLVFGRVETQGLKGGSGRIVNSDRMSFRARLPMTIHYSSSSVARGDSPPALLLLAGKPSIMTGCVVSQSVLSCVFPLKGEPT